MVIIGIGGLTKDLLTDLLHQYDAAQLLFFTEVAGDANMAFFQKHGFNVSDDLEDVLAHFKKDKRFLAAISNSQKRYEMVNRYTELGGKPHYFISGQANINLELSDVSKVNTIIMNNAMVSPGTFIGDGVIVSQYCCVCHDAHVERYVFMAAFAGLSHGHIGEFTFFGVRSFLMPGLTIGKNCFVGTYSLVTKSMADGARAIGIPAKMFRENPVE